MLDTKGARNFLKTIKFKQMYLVRSIFLARTGEYGNSPVGTSESLLH